MEEQKMKTFDELWEDYDALVKSMVTLSKDQNVNKEKILDLEKIKNSLENRLLAYPQSFDKIRMWEIEVSVKTAFDSSDEKRVSEIREIIKNSGTVAQQPHSYLDSMGSLVSSIKKNMFGYILATSVCSDGLTSMIYLCSDSEAKKFCSHFAFKFGKALKCDLVRISRRTASLLSLIK